MKTEVLTQILKSRQREKVIIRFLFSQVLSKVVGKWFNASLKINNILSTQQYGFQKNNGIQVATTGMLNMINESRNKSMEPVSMSLHLQKAFDTVDYKILLGKLNDVSIRGLNNVLMKSYLGSRKQMVKLQKLCSSSKEIICGVPQGSILGQTLFRVYINDQMCNPLKGKVFWLQCRQMQIDVIKNDKWLRTNKLTINVKKSGGVIFGVCTQNLVMQLNNKILQRWYSTKYLESKSIPKLEGYIRKTSTCNSHLCRLRKHVSTNISSLHLELFGNLRKLDVCSISQKV